MTMTQHQVLESVEIQGKLNGLCLELEVTQSFVNESNHAIEAIYTFPLPYQAVLLDLTVKLNEKTLRGSVVPKKKAESDYEDAITEGHSAIMLERADDGLCTINVGNLMAGERAQIQYRFSQLLYWQQDLLRISIPTTMAPRYGSPIKAGFQPHQITEHSPIVEYPFKFSLQIEKPLSDALLECPTHEVNIHRQNGVSHIELANDQAWLDRDLVLNITAKEKEKNIGQYAKDGDKYISLLSIAPQIPGENIKSACIKVLVDCSGSMAGDSIEQARAGIMRILDHLRETDTFNIVRFGNEAHALFPTCVSATKKAVAQARNAIQTLDADLGGTEIGDALEYAYQLIDEGDRPTAILLITDGEVYEHEAIVKRAKESNHRIFTIGVGSAVAESFVREIALQTGGAAELVSPNEGMAEAIYRQFNRMFQPRALSAAITWPSAPNWQSPTLIESVYAGDTLHVFAQFENEPIGGAKLKLLMEDGNTIVQDLPASSKNNMQDLSRIATAHRIVKMNCETEELATSLAVEYQLIGKYTNYLIIEERTKSDNDPELPEVVQVTHMMAAGHGGFGSVSQRRQSYGRLSNYVSRKMYSKISPTVKKLCLSGLEEFDIPAFLRKRADSDEENKPKIKTLAEVIVALIAENDWFDGYQKHVFEILPENLKEISDLLVNGHGWNSKEVAAAILLSIIKLIDGEIQRHILRPLKIELNKVDLAGVLVEYFIKGIKYESDQILFNNLLDIPRNYKELS